MDDRERIRTAAEWISRAHHVIIFTGAGVSTESGIPDFRSPGGLWDRYDPRDFTYQKFLSSAEARRKYWIMHSELYALLLQVHPNAFHEACTDLDRMGKLDCVITQNVDNLHQNAGLSGDKVIELHGNALVVSCLSCGDRLTRSEVQKRIDNGEAVPLCRSCGGLLKPATISFGQTMPVEAMQRASDHLRRCDLFIAAGSSLQVEPASLMPLAAKKAGAGLIIINLSATPYDNEADLLIRGMAAQVMIDIVQATKQRMIV